MCPMGNSRTSTRTSSMESHVHQQRPPPHIQSIYKKYQQLRGSALESDAALLDLRGIHTASELHVVQTRCPADMHIALQACTGNQRDDPPALLATPVPVLEHRHLLGLQIIPSLIPPATQQLLLSRLIHRDLGNPTHKTNVHLHYRVRPTPPQAASFFQYAPSSDPHFIPLYPTVHKPLSITQFLNKKLRWVTLGGQYDWTLKQYYPTLPLPFPADVGRLAQAICPDMTPQAGIVNLYSPGDTLSMHRDVSEACDRALVSVSLGCDGIFVIARNSDPADCCCCCPSDDAESVPDVLALRLRSGDVICMSGEARFAWHGLPQVVPDTCPRWLRDWPASPESDCAYRAWRGWMSTKRINLNVRQMYE